MGDQFYVIGNVTPSGWRSDSFDELDWLVNAAAARGIYVIIDMHGVVGSQSNSDTTGQQGQDTYWHTDSYKAATAYMWSQIASHYNGNPTVAGYDLLNEPDGASHDTAGDAQVIDAYNNLYHTVRSVDPSHIIFMEGAFDGWNWGKLPNPSDYGWTNVVYEMHEYQFNGSSSQVEQGSMYQVSDFNNHAYYNVPGYIGEFNDMGNSVSTWQFTANAYNQAGLSWSMWSYKAKDGLLPDSWGFYDPATSMPPIPNISTDSAATIASDWQQWTTTNAFGFNPSLGISGNENGAGLDTNAWFNVVNQNSGSCVDATGWGTADGTVLQQYTCGSQQYNQEWQFQYYGTGVSTVVNRDAPSEVWDATNYGTANSTPMQTWSYLGGSNQQWRPVSLGNGYYKFVGVASGRCLDVPNFSTANNVQLQIYDCNGSTAQSFHLSQQP